MKPDDALRSVIGHEEYEKLVAERDRALEIADATVGWRRAAGILWKVLTVVCAILFSIIAWEARSIVVTVEQNQGMVIQIATKLEERTAALAEDVKQLRETDRELFDAIQKLNDKLDAEIRARRERQ